MTQLNICFCKTDDELMDGLWDHLIRAYGIENVYVFSDSKPSGSWIKIESLNDIPGQKVFFSPLEGKYITPGKSVDEFSFPEEITLCFGSDEKHNILNSDVECVYIPSKSKTPLYAVQAASIAVAKWWDIHGNHR